MTQLQDDGQLAACIRGAIKHSVTRHYVYVGIIKELHMQDDRQLASALGTQPKAHATSSVYLRFSG
jgi:hypothetical protein